MRQVDRVVAYGCSWTAGSELMDHVHMGVSFEECNAIKKTYIAAGKTHENMHKFIDRYNINDPTNLALNQRSSWAGQLAGLLGKPIDNRAVGGSSLDQAYFELYRDYHEGKILPTDLVLVGLTTAYRIPRFRDSLIGSSQLGYHFRDDKIEDHSLIKLCNDDYLIFNYFKTLSILGSLKSKMNIRLQPVVRENNPFSEHFTFDLKLCRDYANHIWNELHGVFLLSNEYLREYIVDGKPKRCGFMHESIESHTELANKIYNQVKFQ
jgi:hypothetical protein